MSGAPSNTIKKSLMVGYGVPLVIVLIMGIGNGLVIFKTKPLKFEYFKTVELSIEDPCHPIKPKFGVE